MCKGILGQRAWLGSLGNRPGRWLWNGLWAPHPTGEKASQVVGLDRSYDAFVILCLVHERGDLIWQVCS